MRQTRLQIVISIAIAVAGCADLDDDALSEESGSQAVTSCPPTDAPIPYGPSGDIPEPNPVYSWSAVAGVTGYQWESLDLNGVYYGYNQHRTSTSTQGLELLSGVQMRWRVAGRCGEFGPLGPSSPWTYFRYVPPPPPPDDPPGGGHNGQCYPSLRACERECTGVCERRINCGGATAHKCFE